MGRSSASGVRRLQKMAGDDDGFGGPVELGDLLEGEDAFFSRDGGRERKERGQQKGATHDAISSRRPVGLQPDASRILFS